LKKNKQKPILLTPQEYHEQLNACINCIHENNCTNLLPFPLNLSECCQHYQKINKTFNEE
jgi:hypothetical protein